MWYVLAQKGKKQPSLFFDQWHENDELLTDDDDKPLEVYHGTTKAFDTFNLNESNKGNYLGPGHYFTNRQHDLARNYSQLPEDDRNTDLVSKIQDLSENIFRDWLDSQEQNVAYNSAEYQQKKEEADQLAKQQIMQNLGTSMPVYLKTQKWADVRPSTQIIFPPIYEFNDKEIDEDEDEDIWDEEELTEFGQKLFDAIYELEYKYNFDAQEVFGDILEKVNQYKPMSAHELMNAIFSISNWYYEDDEGNITNHGAFVADLFRELGYTGIRMDAYGAFPHMELEPGTEHYIVWDPADIKSSIGNTGLYSRDNPSIKQ
jgi:hypothetical protein